jgi:alkylation response protein AidB-like acyl-CoA dehydrogenase
MAVAGADHAPTFDGSWNRATRRARRSGAIAGSAGGASALRFHQWSKVGGALAAAGPLFDQTWNHGTIGARPAPADTIGLDMDPFADNEDQASLRKLARDLAERELAPRASHWDETEEFPYHSWEALKAAELFGITTGEEYGGMGMGDVESTIVLEELSRADVSSAILCQLIFNGPPRAIEHLGSEPLKQRWLPRVASGDALFCIGITEPDAGSAANLMRANLTEDASGGWRLNAYKNYVTGGHVAAGCLVWCRWPGGDGAKGIGAVVVDLSSPGVSVTGTHRKMGLRGCTEAELAFDDVHVSPEDVLLAGDPGDSAAFRTLLAHLNHERCGNASMCIGAAQGALEHAVRYLNERTVGARPLAELQGLQWKIADMATQLESARLLLYRAVHMAGPHGTPPALETAMAKGAANLAAKFVCDEAIQLLGGYGYSREFPVERAYRDIRGLCIGAGTVEVQRNFVGANVLKGRSPASAAWRPPAV